MRAGKSATECWDRSPATDDELVRLTLVVRALGLAEDHVVQVQTEIEVVLEVTEMCVGVNTYRTWHTSVVHLLMVNRHELTLKAI